MSEYASTPSTGKLKLKGSSSTSGITKKKKKKHPSNSLTTSSNTHEADPSSNPNPEAENNDSQHQDRSGVLAALADEDSQLTKHSHRNASIVDGKQLGEDVAGTGIEDEDPEEANALKTEAERKFGERRRKMLQDRLKKEGVKSHKQRVEDLNKYLSGLSEHHDMPKIGPG